MDEGYVVPSLVLHALRERGYGQLVLSMTFDQTTGREFRFGDMVKRAVAKYVFKRLNAVA